MDQDQQQSPSITPVVAPWVTPVLLLTLGGLIGTVFAANIWWLKQQD